MSWTTKQYYIIVLYGAMKRFGVIERCIEKALSSLSRQCCATVFIFTHNHYQS